MMQAEEMVVSTSNRYLLAGWMSIIAAVLFPLQFIVGIVQGIIGARTFHIKGPIVGPADFLGLISTALAVYVIIMFRQLLHERFRYHGVDLLITISIWWLIGFQVLGLMLKTMLLLTNLPELMQIVMMLGLFSVAMVTVGIVDIMIAVRLLKLREQMSDLLAAYVYLTLAAGILEVTILLSPLALILVPITSIILGVVFLREKEEAEFV
ncbi:MAG: hypothetical protein IT585_08850 [candidate division Zixibacteria bacterium]|nr:hypothetical protein [candidate division Zixibacteria bacterium]